jgi:two-component system chemotaxis sensor kinase CheA
MIKDSTQPEKISIEDQQSVIAFHIGGREHFAISLFLIQHIEKIDRSRIMIANKREYIHYQENIVPVIHIEDAIEDIESSYGDEMFLIILKGARPIGILTAEIIDTTMIKGTFDTETVVRPGIIGADIILGHLTMVLDVFTLIEKIEPDWFRKTGDLTVKNKRILLLEDTNFYSILIKSILSSAGIDVEIARNGNEGLEALSKGGWDFIISDLEMPGMDGYNFARAVRGMEKYRDIPLLAISAMYNNAEGERLALEAGFDSFISKRNKEALMDALKKLSEGA